MLFSKMLFSKKELCRYVFVIFLFLASLCNVCKSMDFSQEGHNDIINKLEDVMIKYTNAKSKLENKLFKEEESLRNNETIFENGKIMGNLDEVFFQYKMEQNKKIIKELQKKIEIYENILKGLNESICKIESTQVVDVVRPENEILEILGLGSDNETTEEEEGEGEEEEMSRVVPVSQSGGGYLGTLITKITGGFSRLLHTTTFCSYCPNLKTYLVMVGGSLVLILVLDKCSVFADEKIEDYSGFPC